MAVHDISTNEALSGIFGSISIASWICLLIPQLLTNYKTKSADGLSMLFLAVWLFGDVTNLGGALVTGLAPTATVLAAYFCVSDLILISQCVYYNTINARKARRRAQSTATDISEDEPLLRRQRTGSSSAAVALPGSQRRSSSGREINPIKRVLTGEDETPSSSAWLHNTLGLAAVWIVGAAGWFLSYRAGAFDQPDDSVPNDPNSEGPMAVFGMVMGYVSAVCYLCARIPQIIKNYKEKSCEGLALLFFMLSMTGNLTYGLSVFCYSQEPQYLIMAIPWLLGSFGTIVEDCVIFYQFRIYSPNAEHAIDDTDGAAA